jgi:hypothetical protein
MRTSIGKTSDSVDNLHSNFNDDGGQLLDENPKSNTMSEERSGNHGRDVSGDVYEK